MSSLIARFTRIAAVSAVGLGFALPVSASDGLVGAYLAARHASMSNDYAAAADFYTRALVRDTSNPSLLEAATVAHLILGDFDAATPVARRLRSVVDQSQIAELVLLADQLRRQDYGSVIADYEAGRETGPLVDGLVLGWVEMGRGNVDEALAAFDAVMANQTLAPFGAYHKALALATAGDFGSAEALLSGPEGEQIRRTRRGAIALIEILHQLERYDEAQAFLNESFGEDPDPTIARLRELLAAREATPFTLVTSPLDGLAEVFFTVAGALSTEAEDTYTLIYARIAEALSPRHADAILLSAELLERQGQYDLATAAYNRIPRDDPAFHQAEIGRAEALRSAGKTDAAIEVLEQLAKSHADQPDVHRALGTLLQSEDRFAEATTAYDAAIALLPTEDASHWVLYYMRGITFERRDIWDPAEADFRKALELEPNRPEVLNYLGYSFLEMGENLDEALAMIKRAVTARPNDGYIVDSLGWALYRLGRYQEAVAPMERAAALMPVDPIVNDHLGDVLWAVGRVNEARFQWRRALSFDPLEDEATRIRRKLEVGLDAVLVEEGAEPISVANDG